MDTRLRARRAPFGFPAEGALGPGKSRFPSKVNAIIETAIKKIYLTDVACSQMNNRQRARSLGRATVVRRMSIAEVFGHQVEAQLINN